MPTFTKGQTIRCIDPKRSNGHLVEGNVYTVQQDSYERHGVGEMVKINGSFTAWFVQRFEAVPDEDPKGDAITELAEAHRKISEANDGSVTITSAPKIVVDHTFPPSGPAIFMGAAEANKIQIGAELPPPEIKPGDWVMVQGQVLEATDDDSPGDYLIEFFSHNEQWSGWVRKDRVQPMAVPPPYVEQCTAMTVNVMDTNVYYRCEKPEHRRFDRQHKSGHFEWLENDTSGYIEEA